MKAVILVLVLNFFVFPLNNGIASESQKLPNSSIGSVIDVSPSSSENATSIGGVRILNGKVRVTNRGPLFLSSGRMLIEKGVSKSGKPAVLPFKVDISGTGDNTVREYHFSPIDGADHLGSMNGLEWIFSIPDGEVGIRFTVKNGELSLNTFKGPNKLTTTCIINGNPTVLAIGDVVAPGYRAVYSIAGGSGELIPTICDETYLIENVIKRVEKSDVCWNDLKRITGQSLPKKAEAWNNWWNKNKD